MDVDKPAENVDPYAAKHIRYKAKELVGRYGFTQSDVKDIEQELTLDYIKRRSKFNPKRSSLHTFIVRIVRHKIASMIEHHHAACRDYRREKHSLDETVKGAKGGEFKRSEIIDAEANHSGHSEQELLELKLDVECITSGLPRDLKPLCKLLLTKTVSELHRELNTPRSTLYEAVKKLRTRFEDAGLRDYFKKT